MGCYAMTATTALTAQNTLGVYGIHETPPEFVRKQIDACVEDIGVDVVKTGNAPLDDEKLSLTLPLKECSRPPERSQQWQMPFVTMVFNAPWSTRSWWRQAAPSYWLGMQSAPSASSFCRSVTS